MKNYPSNPNPRHELERELGPRRPEIAVVWLFIAMLMLVSVLVGWLLWQKAALTQP